nr:hypothetical protein [Tanacetum cinerariifolium]
MDGNVHIYKARLVAKGHTQTPGTDYEETFSPVADIRAIRILIDIAAYYDYEIWQVDVKTVFLNGYLNEEEKLKLSKSQGASTPAEMKRMQNVPYASAIGSIMYDVRCTRHDVANTKDVFLVDGGDLKRELRVSCYTDAGYLTGADDLKSQTEYVFVLNGGYVDCKSTKQSIFATSSAEAEYIAAFDASKEAIWVRKFIFGLSVVPTIKEPISMYYDNTLAIAIANSLESRKVLDIFAPKFTTFAKQSIFATSSAEAEYIAAFDASKEAIWVIKFISGLSARHFRAKVHYLREVIEFGDIKLEKVHTDDNLVDPLQKH